MELSGLAQIAHMAAPATPQPHISSEMMWYLVILSDAEQTLNCSKKSLWLLDMNQNQTRDTYI